jgi:hypothetical protein
MSDRTRAAQVASDPVTAAPFVSDRVRGAITSAGGLMGAKEACQALGCSSSNLRKILKAHPAVRPVQDLAATSVWLAADIEAVAQVPRLRGGPADRGGRKRPPVGERTQDKVLPVVDAEWRSSADLADLAGVGRQSAGPALRRLVERGEVVAMEGKGRRMLYRRAAA